MKELEGEFINIPITSLKFILPTIIMAAILSDIVELKESFWFSMMIWSPILILASILGVTCRIWRRKGKNKKAMENTKRS